MAEQPTVKFITTTSDRIRGNDAGELPNGSIAFVEDTREVVVKVEEENNNEEE